MKKNRKRQKNSRGLKEGIIACILSLVVCLILTAVLIEKGLLSRDMIKIVLEVICVVSALSGGYFGCDKNLNNALIIAAVLCAAKLFMTALSATGRFGGMENTAIFAAMILGALGGGTMSFRQRHKKRRT